MTKKECEMYVRGMFDLYWMIGGDTHCKSYDPLTFEDNIAHSYVLDLEDGGRHHTYKSIEDVANRALLELAERVIYEFKDGGMLWNDYFKKSKEEEIMPPKELKKGEEFFKQNNLL